MNFTSAIETIKEVLHSIGSDISRDDYDGIIVKELKSSNTLDEHRSTNQSHIAITGSQMDMFPYIRAEGYFDCDYNKRDENLKQYFVVQIPVYIHKENVSYLNKEADFMSNDQLLVHVSIVRSRRDDAADQLQMSMTKIDSPAYVQYRKIVHAGNYMVLLKRKTQLLYDLYTVKPKDAGSSFKQLNNHFYRLDEKNLKTIVKIDEIINNQENDKENFHKTGFQSSFSRNRIVFGAPGTGKSFQINKELKELLENGGGYERVTFHPDYSYANFVGTYKPVPYIDSDGKDSITYEYVPGPFMRIFVDALKNSMTNDIKPFLLIIEEINRANVAAVFGDIFQLLDRDDDGVSEYPIQASEDIKKYLARELGAVPQVYTQIRIPDNMFIWATMNSADQGVFPMDTAFKRRWDFTYLGIDDNADNIRGKYIYLGEGKSQKVEWNKLRKAINSFLANEKINEDKQLGPYFISKTLVAPLDSDEIDREEFIRVFKNKVIMYLFEDAAKQKRSKLFEGCSNGYSRYSEICKEFDKKGIGIFNRDIQIDAGIEIS